MGQNDGSVVSIAALCTGVLGSHLGIIYMAFICFPNVCVGFRTHSKNILINWSSERHFIRADPSVVHCQQIQSNLYNNTGGWGLENAIHL